MYYRSSIKIMSAIKIDMTKDYLCLRPNYEALETFDEYYRRINNFLPNFPQAVLKQWLFDHFQSAINRYAWIEFEQLSFRQEIWNTERIINEIKAWNELAVENWKSAFFKNPDYQIGPLITFMHQNGTWPVPPIILDNIHGLRMPDHSLIARWELIEGHHRLAYLRALYENTHWKIEKQHSLWITTKIEKK
jgi:hypothetical protein